MKKLLLIVLTVMTTTMLSGCLYPDKERSENEIPYQEQLDAVQKAVDQFREDSGGLLPIQNRNQDVDLYIKYPISFDRIVPKYLEKTPSSSFEAGGIYQYVLYDVENDPVVKVIDLRTSEKLRELNIKLGVNGYGPIKDQLADNVYSLDYEKMGYKDVQTVPSPYSNVNLPLVATGDGTIYVDYSIELNRLLKETKKQFKPGDDIRSLLIESSPVLPAYSLPYTINDQNEPVFMSK